MTQPAGRGVSRVVEGPREGAELRERRRVGQPGQGVARRRHAGLGRQHQLEVVRVALPRQLPQRRDVGAVVGRVGPGQPKGHGRSRTPASGSRSSSQCSSARAPKPVAPLVYSNSSTGESPTDAMSRCAHGSPPVKCCRNSAAVIAPGAAAGVVGVGDLGGDPLLVVGDQRHPPQRLAGGQRRRAQRARRARRRWRRARRCAGRARSSSRRSAWRRRRARRAPARRRRRRARRPAPAGPRRRCW